MSREDSLLPTSPLIPTDSDEGLATTSRHDSLNSMQGLDIAELKREVARLTSSEAQAIQLCNQISEELQICNAALAKKRNEIFEFAGKLSKQSRVLKDLENKTIALREDTKRQVREIQDELDREKKKRTESDQNMAEPRAEVHAKDTRIEDSEARLSSTENSPDDGYCEVEATARPTNTHHEAGCEEYQQLGDAQVLQAAAEAEVEGLLHLEKANADLTDGHAFDSELIKEMAKEKERYRFEAQQLDDTVGKLRVKQHLASETFQEIELASPAIQPLGFSAMQFISTTPRTPVAASISVTNPALLSQLEDLGTSIMSLSTAPIPKTVIDSPSKMHLTSSLPNIPLTINIKPTDKRNYPLLRRVQGAISATSKLDIHGPKVMVKQFVASMNHVEQDHVEKSQLRADIKALKAQLRRKVKCTDPTHRTLADELEAKTAQFTMQEQLLAHWQMRQEPRDRHKFDLHTTAPHNGPSMQIKPARTQRSC